MLHDPQDRGGGNKRCYLSKKWKHEFTEHYRKKKKNIFAGKSDLKSAFHILGLSRCSWKWLVMKAMHPVTGEWKFFVDKRLPFGASISCSHFQRFSDALQHLIEYRASAPRRITNYLDDFLFIAKTIARCNQLISEFQNSVKSLTYQFQWRKLNGQPNLLCFLAFC